MATEWPIIDIIFEPNFKSIYKQNEAKECFRIFHDYELITYGFSYDGETFIIATSTYINQKRDLYLQKMKWLKISLVAV